MQQIEVGTDSRLCPFSGIIISHMYCICYLTVYVDHATFAGHVWNYARL